LELAFHLTELKRTTWGERFSRYLSHDPSLKWKWVGTIEQWDTFDIKGSRLAEAIQARRHNKWPIYRAYRWLSLKELETLRNRMVLTLAKFRPTLFFAAIHKPQLMRETAALLHLRRIDRATAERVRTPVPIAYTLLQQRAALLVDYVYGDSEGALFLPDEQKGHEKEYPNIDLARRHYESLVERPPDYRLIFAKPLWVRTAELEIDREIVQLIDFCTYAVRKVFASLKWDTLWFREIELYLARHWTTGHWLNAGIVIYPREAPIPT